MSRLAAFALTAAAVAGAATLAWNATPSNPHEYREPDVHYPHVEAAEPHPHGHEPVPTLPADFKYNNRIVETAPAPTEPPVATADPADITGTVLVINGTGYIPCPEEDYEGPTPCFWDATARGDGTGVSFIWDGVDEYFLED